MHVCIGGVLECTQERAKGRSWRNICIYEADRRDLKARPGESEAENIERKV